MLRRLDESWFESIFSILEEAFPWSERRCKAEQRALFAVFEYEVYGWVENGELLAFLAAWNLGTIRFGEHLATRKEQRNRRIGQRLFQAYEALSEVPIVFEVELPINEMAKRRIHFYERLHYHYYGEIEYYQGTFHEEVTPQPLRLMMKDPHKTPEQLDVIIDLIYKHVYHQQRWF